MWSFTMMLHDTPQKHTIYSSPKQRWNQINVNIILPPITPLSHHPQNFIKHDTINIYFLNKKNSPSSNSKTWDSPTQIAPHQTSYFYHCHFVPRHNSFRMRRGGFQVVVWRSESWRGLLIWCAFWEWCVLCSRECMWLSIRNWWMWNERNFIGATIVLASYDMAEVMRWTMNCCTWQFVSVSVWRCYYITGNAW